MHVIFKKIITLTILCLHNGSFMSAHDLLNLLSEFGKSDKVQGKPGILLLFLQGLQ